MTHDRIEAVLTVDIVVTAGDFGLFIERAKYPFCDKLAFPGGHVDEGELLIDAARRELLEEVGIEVKTEDLQLLCVLDSFGRDPRYAYTVSVVYHVHLEDVDLHEISAAGSDAKRIIIRNISSISKSEMAFDHYQAIACLKEKL